MLRVHQRGHEASERGNAVPLSDAQDGRVNVRCASLKGSKGVGDSTSSIIMEVSLDVAADNLSKGRDLFIDLTPGGSSHRVSNSHSLGAKTVDERVQLNDLAKVGAEGVLAGEADLNAVGLGELDDLGGLLGDPVQILAVGMLHELSRRADAHVAVRYCQYRVGCVVLCW